MNIVRVDASLKIGTGHVMRCLTLAEELRRRGDDVCFLCRKHPGHMGDIITRKNFHVSFLPEHEQALKTHPEKRDYSAWLGVSQDEDAKQTIHSLGSEYVDWLIVDHYGLDIVWEKELRPYANRIMVIDDLANRKHDCDLLLDQSISRANEKRYGKLLPDYCINLLGVKYAVIREEFRQARKFCSMRGNGVARILVYFGGNDPNNLTGMSLEALDSPKLSHLWVDTVIGADNPHLEKVEKQVRNRPGTRLHIQPEGFVELMLRADLCIGAGGTTTWERITLGLPSIVITVAENQESIIKELAKSDFVTWIGKKEHITPSAIRNSLLCVTDTMGTQELLSTPPNPVDGFGALRVAEKLVPTPKTDLSLRRAVIEDMEQYFFWANDPVVRENSFQKKPITWREHVTWFRNKLDSSLSEMWVLQTPVGLPVGQIRFDIYEEAVNISYSIDSIWRGRGWGNKLIELGINRICKTGAGKVVKGKVKKTNLASRKVFLKYGFKERIESDVILFWKRSQ